MGDRGRQRSRWGDGVGVAGSAKTGSAVEGYTTVMSLLCFFSTASLRQHTDAAPSNVPQCSGPRLLRLRRVGGNTVLGSSFSFPHTRPLSPFHSLAAAKTGNRGKPQVGLWRGG
jgi:hypothetical protein